MKESKNVLITGTSSGFGRLTAMTLAKKGHHVFATMRDINDRNQEAANDLEDWAKDENLKLDVLELDVTKPDTIQQAIEQITNQSRTLDVIVNNAGVGTFGVNEAFSAEKAREIYDINVFGQMRVINAALPYMRRQKDGLIIQISSVIGRSLMPFLGLYSSCKWALEALTESYHYDLAQLGIEAVIVEPGAYPTDFLDKGINGDRQEVFDQYGKVKELYEKFQEKMEDMYDEEKAQDPQKVADAIANLVDTAKGERPLRTVVDRNQKQFDKINEALEKIDQSFMKQFKVEDLNKVRKKAS